MDAAGWVRGANNPTARLGPSMHMISMLSRPKYPVKPPAFDAGSAGQPKRQEL
jgi:hypothetical protein